MYNTRLIETILELRKQYPDPITDIEIIRQSTERDLARLTGQPVPEIFTEEQRQMFIDNCDHVIGFLESEDGADSIELLMNSFKQYTDGCVEAEEPVVEEEAP